MISTLFLSALFTLYNYKDKLSTNHSLRNQQIDPNLIQLTKKNRRNIDISNFVVTQLSTLS